MGVAALVLGILATLCGIFPTGFFVALPLGVIALVLGIVGRKMAAQNNQPTGLATAGIALGATGMAFAMVWWIACHVIVSKTKDAVEKNFTEPFKKAIEEAEKKQKAEREGLPLDRAGALRTTSAQLFTDWDGNSARFEDKTLEVTGVVDRVRTQHEGVADVLLVGRKHEAKKDEIVINEADDITCRLIKSETGKAVELAPGKKVTVIGIGSTGLFGPVLKGCVFK